MGHLPSSRRAALDGLLRMLDASAPEELFTGPEDDAVFLYGLLSEVARARNSQYYWEICRTARRRGVTPEYVIDRAIVLLATIEERRRGDLYRILGVPGLASGETIRQRWLELAKRHHPDAGGDGARFRQAKQAYEALRDPARRAEYERFWVRALGPFERVASRDDVARPGAIAATPWARPRSLRSLPEPATPPAVGDDPGRPAIGALLRLRTLLAPVTGADIEAARADVARAIEALERVNAELAALAALKQAFARSP